MSSTNLLRRHPLLSWQFLVLGLIGSVPAQDVSAPSTAGTPHVVRVTVGHTVGLGGGGWSAIEPFFVLQESVGSYHSKTKSAITHREWERLQQAIDRRGLASAPQAGCYVEVDGPCSWVAVELSDKTKITVTYDASNAPAPVAALLSQIQALQRRPATGVLAPPGPVRDAARAKQRAEQILAAKKWLSPPLQAKLKDGIWTVMGTAHCQEVFPKKEKSCYGGAGVRLRQSDGAVLEMFPPWHN